MELANSYAWRGKLFVAASHFSLASEVMLILESKSIVLLPPRILWKTPTCTQMETTERIAADVVHGSGFSTSFGNPRGDARYDLCTWLKGKAVCPRLLFRTMRTLQLIRQLRRPSPLEAERRPLGRTTCGAKWVRIFGLSENWVSTLLAHSLFLSPVCRRNLVIGNELPDLSSRVANALKP